MKMVWGLAAVALWAMCPDAEAQQAQTQTPAKTDAQSKDRPAETPKPSRIDRMGAAVDDFFGWMKDNTDTSPDAYDHGDWQVGGGGSGEGGSSDH